VGTAFQILLRVREVHLRLVLAVWEAAAAMYSLVAKLPLADQLPRPVETPERVEILRLADRL
jgi:hypothetical protein